MPKLIHEMSNSWISFTPSVDWVRQMGVKKKKYMLASRKIRIPVAQCPAIQKL